VEPGDWPRKAKALGIAYLVSFIAVLPLIPWFDQLYKRANEFADLGSQPSAADTNPVMSTLGVQLLASNFEFLKRWSMDYFKAPFLIAVAAGALSAMMRRDRVALFLLLALAVPSLVLLDRTNILFSRYFMFTIYPAYVLAALGVMQLGQSVRQRFGTAILEWPRCHAGAAVSLAVLVVVVGAWVPVSTSILVSPAQAPLSTEDHYQYVEQWYALTGLSQMAAVIRASAGSGAATVLEPIRPWWYSVRMPEDALHYYLWDLPNVRFIEVEQLGNAQNLCDLRLWASAPDPVFVVVDGTDTLSGGAEPDVPVRTSDLQASLRRDLPEAVEVLRIPRPNAPNWLSVVQINGRALPPGRKGC
jgi:hypothetical protein